MHLKYIFTLLALTSVFLMYSQNTAESYDLYGKVKSVEHISQNVSLVNGQLSRSGDTEKYQMNFNPAGFLNNYARFNKEGKLIWRESIEYSTSNKKTLYAKYESKELVNKVFVFKYDKNDNLIQKTIFASNEFFDQNGKVVKSKLIDDYFDTRYNYKYDSVNQLIEERVFNTKGEVSSAYSHIYDKEGNCTETILRSDGFVVLRYVYGYDEKGNRRTVVEYGKDDEILKKKAYHYDAAGRKTKEYIYRKNGAFIRKILYTYDANGNLIKYLDAHPNGQIIKKYTYKVDAKGNVIEKCSFDTNGRIEFKETYKYDGQKNQTQFYKFKSDGVPLFKKTAQYKTDTRGNWTQRIGYKNGKPVYITSRVVQYY